MLRVSVIANQSVEENLLDAFKDEGVAKYYTRFNGVHGVGRQGSRMGDAIWPEENFQIDVFCENEEADGIKRAVSRVKEKFPTEGIKVFVM